MDRFWSKVAKSGHNDCWLWTAGKDHKGYGRIQLNGRSSIASRVAWALTHGPVPDGLSVLHRCDTPACVNPAHLWLGTQQDNVTDALSKGRMKGGRPKATHCKRGHAYAGNNIKHLPKVGSKGGGRTCRTCANEWSKEYKRRRRER